MSPTARQRQLLPNSEDAIRLSRGELAAVPASPGLYAIWIVEREALRACGIAGDVPKLLYIGRAGPPGLRVRIGLHVGKPWYELAELLAVRGRVLFPWHQRTLDENLGSRFKPGPLCQLSNDEMFSWQERHLCWSWRRFGDKTADRVERELVRAFRPPLNRSYIPPPVLPPQLRSGGGFPRARSRWLWQIAWAGLLTGDVSANRSTRWRADWDGDEAQVDPLGYPVPRSEWENGYRRIQLPEYLPSEKYLRKLMLDAARDAGPPVLDALRQIGEEELCTWWAAHFGAQFLAQPWTIRNALTASFTLADERDAPGPGILPAERRMRSLAGFERTVLRVRH